MSVKLGRTYSMTIDPDDGSDLITIEFPLTLRIRIIRGTFQSCNEAIFDVFNLSENTRRRIFQDFFDPRRYKSIELRAGYESEPVLPAIFRGNIFSAYNQRRVPDWVTTIQSMDGIYGIANGFISTSLPKGYSMRQAISRIAGRIPKVSAGAIGNFGGTPTRGRTLFGNSWEVLRSLGVPGHKFIDNERLNVLGFGEYVAESGTVTKITPANGILGTPRRGEGRIDIDLIFEPSIVVGQLLEVEIGDPVYDGTFQVIGISHVGTISGAVSDRLVTTVNLWASEVLSYTPVAVAP